MENRHTIAVIGYGAKGSAHAKEALQRGVFAVAGVLDAREDRTEAARADGFRIFPSLGSLLASGTEAVIIATPNDVHIPLALRCLEAGMHVVTEKPAAMDPEELETALRLAEERGLCFISNQNRRWDSDFLAVRRLLEDKTLGDPIRIESRICGSRGIPEGWRRYPARGGGMLYDWGSHLVDQLLLLRRDTAPAWVSCDTEHVFGLEADDGFRLELGFADGSTALAEATTSTYLPANRFFVRGKRGSAVIRDWRERCVTAVCTEPEPDPADTAGIMSPRDGATLRTEELPYCTGDRYELFTLFARAIEGKGPPPVAPGEMRLCQKAIALAFRSAERSAARIPFEQDR